MDTWYLEEELFNLYTLTGAPKVIFIKNQNWVDSLLIHFPVSFLSNSLRWSSINLFILFSLMMSIFRAKKISSFCDISFKDERNWSLIHIGCHPFWKGLTYCLFTFIVCRHHWSSRLLAAIIKKCSSGTQSCSHQANSICALESMRRCSMNCLGKIIHCDCFRGLKVSAQGKVRFRGSIKKNCVLSRFQTMSLESRLTSVSWSLAWSIHSLPGWFTRYELMYSGDRRG